MRAAPALLVLAVLLWTPTPGTANHLDPRNINAIHLAVLEYHPYPDPKGDPFGIPSTEGNESVDWLTAHYSAYWFPTAVFDGVTTLEQTPQGEGGGPFLETYAIYHRAYSDRVLQDTPLTIRLEAHRAPQAVEADVNVTAASPLAEGGLVLRAVLFEDDVTYDGGNGVVNHRFVVRDGPRSEPTGPIDGSGVSGQFVFPVQESWEPGRLGIVAWVQNEDEDSLRFKDHEVLQVAQWSARQTGPTVQANKAVLLELYSATWCAACPPGDAAADELANTLGLSSTLVTERSFAYLRPGAAWILPAALAVGLVASAAIRPRPPKPDERESPG